MSDLENILNRLEKVKRNGSGFVARCPAHDDRNPSLSIHEKGGQILWHCHAGCSQEVVSEALRALGAFDTKQNGGDELAVYRYTDEKGRTLYEVVRKTGKEFPFRVPDPSSPGGYRWGLHGAKRVLYRLPKVIEAVKLGKPVYVVEGEKDAHAVERAGGVATTNPGGAGKWHLCDYEPLRGAKVVIVADKDEAGYKHAAQVEGALQSVAASIETVEAREGDDAHDHLQAGHGLSDFVSPRIETYRGERNSTTSEGIKLPFKLLRDVIADAPSDPPWIWDGYLAPSALTLLAGRPKVGKSTLLFGLLRALESGDPVFLDRALRSGAALLLTEERAHTLADKAGLFLSPQGFPIRGDTTPRLIHALLHHETSGVTWQEIVSQSVSLCHENDLGLLIVDTLPQWSLVSGKDENDAGAVLEQLRPLQTAAGAGLAILLVSHQRKSFGEFGEAVRGSGALTGGVDIVLELERASTDFVNGDGLRILRAISRFSSTPAELVIGLTEDGYEAKGDSVHAQAEAETEQILSLLADSVPLSTKAISESLSIPNATVNKRLVGLREQGKVARTGPGKANHPFLWSVIPHDDESSELTETQRYLLDPHQEFFSK